jgi:Leucine-rich repeat (LRR) protein
MTTNCLNKSVNTPERDSTSKRACPQCDAEGASASDVCPHSAIFGADSLLGETIANRYTISSVIGMGGWSSVYQATDASLNRAVAMKILHPHLCIDQGNMERFRRESAAMAALNHPNLAVIFDCGQLSGGRPYFVMELIEGKSLAETIQNKQRMVASESVRIFSQICQGLDAIHKAGLIHRDLKPSNVLITEAGTVKVLDFGLAKWILQDNPLTKTDEVMGTPAYMSPEQCLGQKLDYRSDIYSLGCMLYESLAGAKPFSSDNSLECMQLQIKSTPPKLSFGNPELKLPAALEAVVMRCIAKYPEDRFNSSAELRAALEKSLDKPSLAQVIQSQAALIGIGKRQRRQSFWLMVIFLIVGILTWAMVAELGKQRTIEFPGGRSVGTLFLIEKDANGIDTERRQYAPARGEVKVPVQAIVQLDQIPDAEATRLAFLSQIKENDIQQLGLYNAPVGIDAITAINHLIGLKTISFKNSAINDEILSSLNLPALEGLDLSETKISDDAVTKMADREVRLKWIDLRGDKNITDRGVCALAKLQHLNCPKLDNLPLISDRCLATLIQAPALTIVTLNGDNISDTGLKYLSRKPQLLRIELSGTGITDAGVEDLVKLPQLRRLDLSNTAITDKSIDALAQVKHLKNLFISSTKLSATGVSRLKKALPECEITARD